MKNMMKYLAQLIWLFSGILALLLLVLAIPIVLDTKATIKDMRGLVANMTIEDIRQTMNIIEKELDRDLFEQMTYRGYITDRLIEWTPENWRAFLDFCDNTGYIVTDENWQRYIHGELNP